MSGLYKQKLNKRTGVFNLVPSNQVVAFKPGVANAAALPTEGNEENDARVTNDTHHLYVWSGTAWVDQGDLVDLTWAALQDKPSSAVADIDDAVSKRHTQNTDKIVIVSAGEIIDSEGANYNNTDYASKIAQTIAIFHDGDLSKVSIRATADAGETTLEIRTVDEDGIPTETILASKTINISSEGFVDFEFDTPIEVNKDDNYAIVVIPSGEISDQEESDLYPYGNYYKFDGGNWNLATDRSLTFKLYVIIEQADIINDGRLKNDLFVDEGIKIDNRDLSVDGAKLDLLDLSKQHTQNTDTYLDNIVKNVLYVDGNRSDVYTANGSITKPFKKIQDAIDAVTSPSATNKYVIEIAPGAYYSDALAINKVYVTFRSCGVQGARISGAITVTNPGDPTPEQITFMGLRISGGLTCLASHIAINVIDSNITGTAWTFNPSIPTDDEYLQVWGGLWYANATLTNVYTYIMGGGLYSTFTVNGKEFNINNADINEPFEAILSGTLVGSAFGNRAGNSKFTLNTGVNLHIDADTEGGSIITLAGGTLTRSTKAANIINTPAGTIAATDVQSAINELDTEKTTLALVKADIDVADAISKKHTQNQDIALDTDKIVVDYYGNVNITPAIAASFNVLRLKLRYRTFLQENVTCSIFSNNLYISELWRYKLNGAGSIIACLDGATYFQNAPVGVAENLATLVTNMIILANGKVGIGTATPNASYVLDVVGNAGATVKLQNTNNAGFSEIDLFDDGGNAKGGLFYANSGSGGLAGKFGFWLLTATDFAIYSGATCRLISKGTTGYVGIGTATPAEKLDVVGTIKASEGIFIGDNEVITGGITSASLSVNILWDSAWKYRADGSGAVVRVGVDNLFALYTVASGIAGNTATLIEKLSINNNGDTTISGELKIKVYSQDTEPTLGASQRLALWVDTNDNYRTYLMFRRAVVASGLSDQVKVELA